jgi:hypothetical protein
MSRAALHEAGYDSYLTGIVYASMVKVIEQLNLNEYQRLHGSTQNVLGITINNSRTERKISCAVPPWTNVQELAHKQI